MLYTAQQIIEDFQNIEKISVGFTESNTIRKDGTKYLPEGFSQLYSDFWKKDSNIKRFELGSLSQQQRFQIYGSECYIPMMDKIPLAGMNVYYNYHDSEGFVFVETFPPQVDNKTILKTIRPSDQVNSVMVIDKDYNRTVTDIEKIYTCL